MIGNSAKNSRHNEVLSEVEEVKANGSIIRVPQKGSDKVQCTMRSDTITLGERNAFERFR